MSETARHRARTADEALAVADHQHDLTISRILSFTCLVVSLRISFVVTCFVHH
jgi:hypothetical protein